MCRRLSGIGSIRNCRSLIFLKSNPTRQRLPVPRCWITITPLRPASDFAYAAVLPLVLNGYRHLEPVKFKAKDAVYEESTIVNIPADSVPSDSMPSPEWIAIERTARWPRRLISHVPNGWRESRSRQFTLDMMHSLMTFSLLTTEYTY